MKSIPKVRGFRLPALAWAIMLRFCAASAFAQFESLPRDDVWVPDGPVLAAVETNGVVYIGGRFDYLSPVSTTGAAHDLASGSLIDGFPSVAGAIKVILPDNKGGWYVGGLFTSVAGHALTNLAHIRADNSVDTNWAPNPNGTVLTLALGSDLLYVGGVFTKVSGLSRIRLAALDPDTGEASAGWQADVTTGFPNGRVTSLVLSEGILYVGGYFGAIHGEDREKLGAVDAQTGALAAWHPNDYTGAQAGSSVETMAISGTTLFVGGSFTDVAGKQTNGVLRNFLAAFDVTVLDRDSVTEWNPNADGHVLAMAVTCDTVYVGGEFEHVGGQPRQHIAALDLETGAVKQDWNPGADHDVLSLALAGDRLYAGGNFRMIGGQARSGLAALDAETGATTLWNPRADTGVRGLAVAGEVVFSGGALGPGGVVRRNLAALDTRTGRPLDWAPTASGVTTNVVPAEEGIRSLTLLGNTLYIGGAFTNINGGMRNRVGAVDRISGALTGWNPDVSSVVEVVRPFLDEIYVGGRFKTVGVTARTNLASVNPLTGDVSSWNPNPNDKVFALTFRDVSRRSKLVYPAGRFTSIGGQNRNRLASWDVEDGALTSWNPSINDQINSVDVLGDTLYLAGAFTLAGGLARSRLAAVDVDSGSVLACWNPDVRLFHGAVEGFAGINKLTLYNGQVFFGGTFNRVSGLQRNNLAAVDAGCPPTLAAWAPIPDNSVNALAVSSRGVMAGGAFQLVGGQYRPYFAVFPVQGWPRIVQQPASQLVSNGVSVVLQASATGNGSLAYQWQFNGIDIPGATSPTLGLPNVQPSASGQYTLIVTNLIGLTTSRAATLTVLEPLVITAQPQSQTVSPGANVTLNVTVQGHPAPTYQWRLNGENIPGAIQSSYTISGAQPLDGGSYDVVVANVGGALLSDVATVIVTSPALSFADHFVDRGTLAGASGVGSGSNASATRELGEPPHAGKVGGQSVWLTWTAPASGIATFNTRGSTFDTLLAIYTGSSVDALSEMASDEDRGGFFSSQAAFNAVGGQTYAIAIDGFFGTQGHIVLTWSLDTSDAPFPRILTHPLSQSVPMGTTATFSVLATSPSAESYQWFFGCRAIEGATNVMLTIENVGPEDVGEYRVFVMNVTSSRIAESEVAVLEIGPDPDLFSHDKAEDVARSPAAGGGFADLGGFGGTGGGSGFLPVAMGSIDAQTLNNENSGTGLGEPLPCGVPGGASRWFGLQTESDGTLMIDTLGSDFNTVLAVYQYTNNLNYFFSFPVACDNDGAPDKIRSVVRFEAKAGVPYLVVVDGVNRDKGTARLNWALGRGPARGALSARWDTDPSGRLWLLAWDPGAVPAPTYQWYYDGQPIPGATSGTYMLENGQINQFGLYSVEIQNNFGTLTTPMGPVLIPDTTVVNGVFRFWLLSPSAEPTVLESSTDFEEWVPFHTSPPSAGPALVEVDTQTQPARYFRVQPGP